MVKADGYGHGMLPVGPRRARPAAPPGWAPRRSRRRSRCGPPGSTRPVLAWLLDAGESTRSRDAVAAGIDIVGQQPSGSSTRSSTPPARPGRTARVHLKVDTGLSRNGGVRAAMWPTWCAAAPGAADGRRGRRRVEPPRLRRRARAPDDRPPARALRRGTRARGGGRTAGRAARHLGQLGGGADPARRRTSTWCARASRSTASRRCRRATAAWLPGDDPARDAGQREAGPRPARASPTATPTRPTARPRSPWCRSATATGSRGTPRTSRPGRGRRPAVPDQRAGLHGPVRGRRRRPRGQRRRRGRAVRPGHGRRADAPTTGPTRSGTIHYEIVTRIGARVPRTYVELA